MQTKFLPLILLVAFSAKGLIWGLSSIEACTITALGIISFLYEMNIQHKYNKSLELKIAAQQASLKKAEEEIQTLKAFMTSIKMNGLRNVNGIAK